MEQNMERQQLVQEYKQAVVPLLRYLPWLEANRGKPGNTYYEGPESTEHSMKFPVYDSTLISFVKEASRSSLMDRNYSYVYTRNRIKTHEDERKIIGKAELKDWEILRGILSKYVLEGMTKAALWGEAVRENIFVLTLKQMRNIVEYWDRTKR